MKNPQSVAAVSEFPEAIAELQFQELRVDLLAIAQCGAIDRPQAIAEGLQNLLFGLELRDRHRVEPIGVAFIDARRQRQRVFLAPLLAHRGDQFG